METTKFLNCKIDASKKIFRPRIETEFWVKKELKRMGPNADGLMVLDMFSGTGCIGIAILKNIKNSRVDFADIWPQAIEQIKMNLKLNNIKNNFYKIYKSDLFERLESKKYDFIFANPPYIALDRISEVQEDVLGKDHHQALFAGKDGTVLIERFFDQVASYLKPEGKIFLEIDPFQKNKIEKILEDKNFETIFKKDQFGKIRWLEAKFRI